MDYSILLQIYFVPETMACFLFLKLVKTVPVSQLLYLLLPLWKVLALALCFAGFVSSSNCQPKWHLLEERTLLLSLSQPPTHGTVLGFLQSWDSTSSLSASLLSFNRKLMESSTLGSSFTAVPPIPGAELKHSRGCHVLVEGRKEGREGERGERKDKNA